MPNGDNTVRSIAAAIERENLAWTPAETDLAALPPEEQQKRLGVLVTSEERASMAAETLRVAAAESTRLTAFAAPTAVDWRNKSGNWITPVKNQGGCGSCVAFCTCATIESALRIRMNSPSLAVDLSEGFLQFCGGGSCSGWGLTSGLEAARTMGVTDEACMPYQATNMNCAASRCSDWQNRLTKIASYSGYASTAARKDAIANKGPLLAGMAVYSDFFAYSSGVYVKTSSASLSGYHCICIVGYDDNQQCWILKNSWGPGWGDNGFCRIRYNQPDLLIDSSWQFYSAEVIVAKQWHRDIAVNQTYASHHSQNAHAHFQGLGWRRIQPGSMDGVTRMLALFAEASANGRRVTINADADLVYQAYLL